MPAAPQPPRQLADRHRGRVSAATSEGLRHARGGHRGATTVSTIPVSPRRPCASDTAAAATRVERHSHWPAEDRVARGPDRGTHARTRDDVALRARIRNASPHPSKRAPARFHRPGSPRHPSVDHVHPGATHAASEQHDRRLPPVNESTASTTTPMASVARAAASQAPVRRPRDDARGHVPAPAPSVTARRVPTIQARRAEPRRLPPGQPAAAPGRAARCPARPTRRIVIVVRTGVGVAARSAAAATSPRSGAPRRASRAAPRFHGKRPLAHEARGASSRRRRGRDDEVQLVGEVVGQDWVRLRRRPPP